MGDQNTVRAVLFTTMGGAMLSGHDVGRNLTSTTNTLDGVTVY